MIRKMKKRELPSITPFRVHEHFINLFVRDWEKSCLDVFGNVETILEDTVKELSTHVFGRFRRSGLFSDVKYFSHSLIF